MSEVAFASTPSPRPEPPRVPTAAQVRTAIATVLRLDPERVLVDIEGPNIAIEICGRCVAPAFIGFTLAEAAPSAGAESIIASLPAAWAKWCAEHPGFA